MARETGHPRVTLTSLVKYVYLLDWLHASEAGGQTYTQAAWTFSNYGPYAVQVAERIERLADIGVLQKYEGEHRDREYSQYWLGEYPIGPELSEVGLSPLTAFHLQSVFRKTSNDLPSLLDYVYFDTEPMKLARPREQINFGLTIPAAERAKRAEAVYVQDHGKIRRLAELAGTLSGQSQTSNAAAMAAHRPIYDQRFADEMGERFPDDSGLQEGAFYARLG